MVFNRPLFYVNGFRLALIVASIFLPNLKGFFQTFEVLRQKILRKAGIALIEKAKIFASNYFYFLINFLLYPQPSPQYRLLRWL